MWCSEREIKPIVAILLSALCSGVGKGGSSQEFGRKIVAQRKTENTGTALGGMKNSALFTDFHSGSAGFF